MYWEGTFGWPVIYPHDIHVYLSWVRKTMYNLGFVYPFVSNIWEGHSLKVFWILKVRKEGYFSGRGSFLLISKQVLKTTEFLMQLKSFYSLNLNHYYSIKVEKTLKLDNLFLILFTFNCSLKHITINQACRVFTSEPQEIERTVD